MKLWELAPNNTDGDDSPWNPWYDKCFKFVIRAKTAKKAREIAEENAGDENKDCRGNKYCNVWLDSKLTYCIELKKEGEEILIIKDLRNA
jgi:hypothetical protein